MHGIVSICRPREALVGAALRFLRWYRNSFLCRDGLCLKGSVRQAHLAAVAAGVVLAQQAVLADAVREPVLRNSLYGCH